MEKYLDRITEAYNGDMGEWMRQKSRERIDWICSKAAGKKILDVGCSQGIVPIILGRGGLEVTGIDIAAESIEYANKSLIHEDFSTQKNVRFFCGDFLQLPFEENAYDTIVMTELLEHVDDPRAIVDKACLCLRDNGRVIVSVPFGINDWPDHKRIYYLADIYELLSRHFSITDIQLFGKWIGYVADSILTHEQTTVGLDLALLRREEKEFLAIERELLDNNNNEKNKRQKLEALYKQQNDKNTALIQEHSQLLEEKNALMQERDQLANEKAHLLKINMKLAGENKNLHGNHFSMTSEKAELNKTFFQNKHVVNNYYMKHHYDMALLCSLNEEYRSKPIQPSYPSYDDSYQLEQAEKRAQHLQSLTDVSGKRILEIGCGGGYTSYILARNNSCSVTGIDIYQNIIWERLNCDDLAFYCLDLSKENPLEPESFDLIISYVAWEHMRHPFEVLQQATKLLVAETGQLYIYANLYRSAIASHLYRNIFFPWPHLLFNDETVIQYALEQGVEQWWIDAFYFVNKLTYSEYKEYFSLLELGIVFENKHTRNVDLEFYERFEEKLGLYPISDLELDFFEVLLVKRKQMSVERHNFLLSNVKVTTPVEKYLCGEPLFTTIKATGVELKYAWYIYLNGEIIMKKWYTDSPDMEYTPQRSGIYKFQCFVQDSLGNKKTTVSVPVTVIDSNNQKDCE